MTSEDEQTLRLMTCTATQFTSDVQRNAVTTAHTSSASGISHRLHNLSPDRLPACTHPAVLHF